ncbi:MAG: hypothetical protein PHN45_02775 [Methylococcales bacterium]|nr:hypothetical protein [Methylococcales bacterium]MDD5753655.1 hypothetical protein [Methylococcales bacterium]
MQTTQENYNDSFGLSEFFDMLSDEFMRQTGFGAYAYITPLEIHDVYQEFQKEQTPIRNFAHDYVRTRV